MLLNSVSTIVISPGYFIGPRNVSTVGVAFSFILDDEPDTPPNARARFKIWSYPWSLKNWYRSSDISTGIVVACPTPGISMLREILPFIVSLSSRNKRHARDFSTALVFFVPPVPSLGFLARTFRVNDAGNFPEVNAASSFAPSTREKSLMFLMFLVFYQCLVDF